MSMVLAAYGYEVTSTDIADCGFGIPGIDFLACRECPGRMPPHHHESALSARQRPMKGSRDQRGRRLSFCATPSLSPSRNCAGPTGATSPTAMGSPQSGSPEFEEPPRHLSPSVECGIPVTSRAKQPSVVVSPIRLQAPPNLRGKVGLIVAVSWLSTAPLAASGESWGYRL
jgi:hypothetical protein